MDYKRCGNQIVLRLDKGDELLSSIKELADKESISSASSELVVGTVLLSYMAKL